MATTICNKYVSGNAVIDEEEDTMDNKAVRQREHLEKVVSSLSVETNGKVKQIKFSQNAQRQQGFAE